jgi:hypothetical protein
VSLSENITGGSQLDRVFVTWVPITVLFSMHQNHAASRDAFCHAFVDLPATFHFSRPGHSNSLKAASLGVFL